MPPNSVKAEYLELWGQVLKSVDNDLPPLLESGLASQEEKLNVDSLDLITRQNDRILSLRRELKDVDQLYADKMAELSSITKGVKSEEILHPSPGHSALETGDDSITRIADFLHGLVVSLRRDFTKAPDLEFVLQQVYLFQTSNLKS